MNKIFRTSLAIIAATFMVAQASQAEGRFHLDAGLGAIQVSSGGFEGGYVVDPALAYENGVVYRVGVLAIRDLQSNKDTDRSEREVEVSAVYLGVSKALAIKRVKAEIGGGVVFSNAEAYYDEEKVGEDREISPYLNVKLILDLTKFLSMQTDWKYIDDVSGGDFHVLEAGVRFSF